MDDLGGLLTARYMEPFAARVFVRALAIYLAVKCLLMRAVIVSISTYHLPDLPHSWLGKMLMAPTYLAYSYPDIFVVFAIIAAAAVVLLKPSYILNALLFYIALNLYATLIPVGDGSDLVLFMLTFLGLPLVPSARIKTDRARITSIAFYNLSRVCVMALILMIYFVSGVDKLMNSQWRSGVAFEYIQHLAGIYNDELFPVVDNKLWNVSMAWLTIVYELSFCALILAGRYRIMIVVIGMLFHLAIWWILSLPDFALVMMIALLIFLNDGDYRKLRRRFRPSPL